MSNNMLTDEEKALLQEYLEAMDALEKKEPLHLSDEVWNEAIDAWKAKGEIPAEYRDKIGIIEKDGKTSFTEKEWEKWHFKEKEIIDKYHDVIVKALKFSADGGNVAELIKALLVQLEQSRTFSTIRQGTATNSLTKARDTEKNIRLAIDGTATISKDGFSVIFADYKELGGLRTSTKKLLDALTIQFTETGAKSKDIHISLSEYMNKCGLRDRKEARKQVRADLNTLGSMALSFTDTSKGAAVTFVRLNMFERVELRRDDVSAKFTEDFYSILINYPVMPYPVELLKLNNRDNPNSYNLMRKIAEHKNMNFDKPNADTISVSTLLKVCPYIPTYEEVKNSNRNFTDRIIEPFERDMTACKNVFTWEYCHSNNTPLTDGELQDFNYDIFEDLLVKINWISYPDTTARLEKKKSRKQGKKS